MNIQLNAEENGEDVWDFENPDFGTVVEKVSLLGKIVGVIHDAPLVVDLRRYAARVGMELPAEMEHGSNAAILAVQTTFHSEAFGLPYINSVGIEVRFRDDVTGLNRKVPCRVMGYLPERREIEMAGAELKSTLAFRFGHDQTLNRKTFSMQPSKPPDDFENIDTLDNLKVGASASLKGSILLSTVWKRTTVEAWGLNNWGVRWRFFKDKESLVNREFSPWCFVAFNSNFISPFQFEARLLFDLWTGIVPRICFSKWQPFEVIVET